MQVSQLFLIFAVIAGCSCAEVSTNPSSSHFFNRKLLKHLKSYIDVEANPCEDFYQYACGKWSEANSIDEDGDNEYSSAVTKVNYEINYELSLYMEVMNLRNKSESVQKAHSFYKSCVDAEETFDLIYFMNWMEEHEGMAWALLSPTEKTNRKYDWVHTLAIMRRYGMNGIFIEEELFETDDSSKSIIVISKPQANEGFTALTTENLVSINESLTLPTDRKRFVEFWSEISEFEVRLVELNDVPADVGVYRGTVGKVPLPWIAKYLETVLDLSSSDSNTEIQAQNMPYLEALGTLLQEYDDEFLCRYLEVRFLWYLDQLPTSLSITNCVDATRGLLSLPMNWIYEQQHPELRNEIPKIHEVFDNIVAYIKKKMSADKSGLITKEFLAILDKIQLKVGNLPRTDTTHVLDAFYANLTLNSTDFYGNLLKVSLFNFKASHSGSGNYLTTDLNQLFYVDSYEDGAGYLPYYLSTPNVIIAPLSLMRQPFYHWGYDDVYKYSSLGNRFALLIINGILQSCQVVAEDLLKVVQVAGLHSAYGAYYSLLPDNLREEKFLKGAQLIFFLNNAQHNCDAEKSIELNPYMSVFSEFNEAFDCKLKKFMEPFENLPSNVTE